MIAGSDMVSRHLKKNWKKKLEKNHRRQSNTRQTKKIVKFFFPNFTEFFFGRVHELADFTELRTTTGSREVIRADLESEYVHTRCEVKFLGRES